MSELSFERVLIQVKDALQRNGIKLWEPPYYLASEANESELMILANTFSSVLNIRVEYCNAALNELQNHAVDKLKSNDELKKEGLATIKVRISRKNMPDGAKVLSLKIKLTESAQNLQNLISNEIEIPPNRLKLISSGKVLHLDKSLLEQNVKNFQQILALEMVINEEQATTENQSYDRIQKIRKDAELLLKTNSNDYFKLENQNGEAIHLPESERTSIMMALLLHEKGRVQLKCDNYNDALILFLEADNEIQSCQSSIIKSIDNIALLNLDIVWCYLKLKSINQLPDADRRLQICEENFKKTYGQNFERVKMIKDSDLSERCFIVRLKLMKGVLYFHQNRHDDASRYLSMVEREINGFKIDDEKVAILIEMGYLKNEAVNALRSTTSIDAAINFILERRQKLSEARAKGRKERVVGKFLEELGIGFDVNPKSVCTLSEMGFSKEIAALALSKSKGDIPEALNLLQNQHESLKTELCSIIKPSSELIEQLKTFGFDEALATNVLKMNINNFDAALEVLLQMQKDGNFEIPIFDSIFPSTSSSDGTASTSSSRYTSTSSDGNVDAATNVKKRKADDEAKMAIFDDLRNDLNHLEDDDEYLTFTMDQEIELLNQYKRALG